MVTVRAAPPDHWPWLAERSGASIYTATFRAIEAVDGNGRIVAMVGYDSDTPNAVMMHVALAHAAALRHVLAPGFEAAFLPIPKGFGKQIAVVSVLSTNAASLKLVQKLGFSERMRGRDWWAPGVDLVWLEMRSEDCRFLRRRDRKAA